MSMSPEDIQKAFEAVQAYREENSNENSKHEGISLAKPVGRLAEVESTRPEFNNAANAKMNHADRGTQGSEMVEKDKTSPELKPSPNDRDRKDVDRDAHSKGMRKDDMEAKKAEILRMADQIRAQEAQELSGPQYEMGR